MIYAGIRKTAEPPALRGAVELLLVEQAGSKAALAASPLQVSEHARPVAVPPTAPPASVPQVLPAPRATKADPTRHPSPYAEFAAHSGPTEPNAASPPPHSFIPLLRFNGTDSDTNAEVFGQDVLPASIDNRYRNRAPRYPDEAAARGQQGAVLVIIHVTPQGTAGTVDLAESSGWPLLDQAAVATVKQWRFHPALRDGKPVPFDMPLRFEFRPL